ncbi:uncharacterized protein LOC123666781 [Melitaea cinxia]|uniref:uncharacterized protein LOC123666781 n=1 Tax=Melitaea cinxia TaxID=113334 RepID=UPI001E273E0E|nr:uncharacterized protein LOC123666781 [Melitaea cinxia]
MEKFCVEFSILPANDGKANIFCLTSIATCNDKVYAIQEEYQSVVYHKELIKTPTITKVKNSLKKRYQVRRVWITMTEELKKVYLDEDDNLLFENQYLEEIKKEQTAAVQNTEAGVLEKLLEKLVQNTQDTKQLNLKHIAERFVIEKFTSKNMNANQQIDIFEKECI